MKASIVDLRYRMKEVLDALRRNEEVEVFYHGKRMGRIIPERPVKTSKKTTDYAFFASSKAPADAASIEKEMEKIRAPRYRDI